MKELLTVIVPAAGAGKRMGLGKNKAFITVRGIPLLILCMKMLAETGMVRRVVIVTRAAEIQETEILLEEYRSRCFPDIDWQVAAGGKERQDQRPGRRQSWPDSHPSNLPPAASSSPVSA